MTKGGESSPFLVLPDVADADYIVKLWHESGTVMSGASGPTALNWQELKAWREENDLELTNYEVDAIRRMSIEYVSEYYEASDKTRPAPYVIEIEELDRTAVGNKIKNIFKSLKGDKEEAKYSVEENRE